MGGALATWTQQWTKCGENIGARHLDSAMASLPLKPDSELNVEAARSRRRRLALMRGMQTLLAYPAFRVWVTSAPTSTERAPTNGILKSVVPAHVVGEDSRMGRGEDVEEALDDDLDVLSLLEPPKAAALPADSSPRGLVSHASRDVKARCPSVPAGTAGSGFSAFAAASPTCPVALDPSDNGSAGALLQPAAAAMIDCRDYTDERTTPGRATSLGASCAKVAVASVDVGVSVQSSVDAPAMSRPVTPSWLEPPWPRLETTQFRPGTSSTAEDLQNIGRFVRSAVPRRKFIDGQAVSLRAVSGARLPPLEIPKFR